MRPAENATSTNKPWMSECLRGGSLGPGPIHPPPINPTPTVDCTGRRVSELPPGFFVAGDDRSALPVRSVKRRIPSTGLARLIRRVSRFQVHRADAIVTIHRNRPCPCGSGRSPMGRLKRRCGSSCVGRKRTSRVFFGSQNLSDCSQNLSDSREFVVLTGRGT